MSSRVETGGGDVDGTLRRAVTVLAARPGVRHHRDVIAPDGFRDTFSGGGLEAIVIWQPGRWLGLDLSIRLPGEPVAYYWIDTDLYDVSKPEQADFLREVAADIVALLGMIARRTLPVGRWRGRPAFVVPDGERFRRVVRGRIGCAAAGFDTMADALAGGDWFCPDLSSRGVRR
ncbi:hypothetical protein LX16_3249 [Stackebrandtia albiflava]|uniref:Uncharacterized protein n=1 Tax=Stackebrandtia albiflava TaxID=406432 RepID=A0A562V3N0_9ACTN|nr:hypothetical protein [Stackebrandtia albiflava]TWJ12491.1 hypothetical protein LX16_3249 [Stackebrandtia albiflava]